MVDYEAKDLIKILLKKWYIIAFIAIAFGIVSIPLAQRSYKQALSNYNLFISQQDETKTETENEVEECSSFCILKVSGMEKSDLGDKEAASIVYYLLSNSSVKAVINNNVEWDNTVDVATINEQSRIALIADSNTILISSDSLSKDNFEKLIIEMQNVLETKMGNIVGQQIEIQFGDVVSETIPQTEEGKEDDDFAKAVMQKPSEMASYKKTMLTAGILGILVGTLVVLIKEYMDANRKMNAVGEN